MKLAVATVANRAAVRDGLLHIEGGGWEFFGAAAFPVFVAGEVGGILELDPSEIGTTPAVTITVTDQDGHPVGSSASMIVNGMRPEAPGGVPSRVPFATPFSASVHEPMVLSVRFDAGGEPLGSVPFAVVEQRPPPGTTA